MIDTKIENNKELSQSELLKRIELIEEKLDRYHKDKDDIVKISENKFMWELNLEGIEMLRSLKYEDK